MWHKPRKAEEDVVSYLYQINTELDSHLAKQKTQEAETSDENPVELIIENIFDELKNRVASVALHRYGSQILEKILQNSTRAQFGRLLSRLSSYYFYLATNRYGSHMLEMCLAICSTFAVQGQFDLADISVEVSSVVGDEVEGELQQIETSIQTVSLNSLIVSMTEELLVSPVDFFFLWRHNSACHVIQSLVCLLTGLPIIQFRRGNNAKHAHSSVLDQELNVVPMHESLIDSRFGGFNLFYSNSPNSPFHSSSESRDALNKLLTCISSAELKHVTESCASTIEGSLSLSLILRVLVTRTSEDDESALLIDGEISSNCWTALTTPIIGSSSENNSNTFHALSGESSGSLLLQTIIETCDKPLLRLILANNVSSQFISSYSSHPHGNYVIQSLIRRFSTVPSSKMMVEFWKLVQKIVVYGDELSDKDDNNEDGCFGFISSLVQHRFWGVLFRLFETVFCLLQNFCQKDGRRNFIVNIARVNIKCLVQLCLKDHGIDELTQNWDNLLNEDGDDDDVVLVPLPECFVNWLLRPSSMSQAQATVNANGAKILSNIFPSLSRQLSLGLVGVGNCRHLNHSDTSLISLSMDRFTYGLLIKKLLNSLDNDQDSARSEEVTGCLISQVCSFFNLVPFPLEVWNSFCKTFQGCDCLKLAFDKASLADKARLVSALCDFKEQSDYGLKNSVYFKNVFKYFMCDVFLYAGQDKWTSKVVRLQKTEDDFMNIINDVDVTRSRKQQRYYDDDDDANYNHEDEGKEKSFGRNIVQDYGQKQQHQKRKWNEITSDKSTSKKKEKEGGRELAVAYHNKPRHELISYLKGSHVLSQRQIEEQIVGPIMRDLNSRKK